jgi:hypothetical protein
LLADAAKSQVADFKLPWTFVYRQALECRLVEIIQLHDLDGTKLHQYLTIGQVVGVHIDPTYVKDGLFDLLATHPIQRAGYVADYTEATTGFKMARPQIKHARSVY